MNVNYTVCPVKDIFDPCGYPAWYYVWDGSGFQMNFLKKKNANQVCRFLNEKQLWPKGVMTELDNYVENVMNLVYDEKNDYWKEME